MIPFLYAVNSSAQTVTAAASVLSFGTVNRKNGCAIGVEDGAIQLKQAGHYFMDSNFTFVPSGTGSVTIALYKDGTPIKGAQQTFTVETATSVLSMSIPAIVKTCCCKEVPITAVISGVAGSVTNAAILVEKA